MSQPDELEAAGDDTSEGTGEGERRVAGWQRALRWVA
jgi:hypothetical protein